MNRDPSVIFGIASKYCILDSFVEYDGYSISSNRFLESRSLLWRCGLVMARCRVGGTECSSASMGPVEGGPLYLHYLHHSLASGQTTGSPAHQQKIGLKIYWAWPRPSEQVPVSPSVSLSHQEASISLLSLSISRQNENHNHRKLTKPITWTTALSNSMKLWAMLCRANQEDGS